MPIVAYGFNWHHIDFPGHHSIDATHLIDYLLDITRSLAYHGFKKMLLLSVHGSNKPFLRCCRPQDGYGYGIPLRFHRVVSRSQPVGKRALQVPNGPRLRV